MATYSLQIRSNNEMHYESNDKDSQISAQNNKLPMRLPATNTTTRRKMIDFILISQRHVRPQTKYKQKTVGTSVRAGESKQCANVRENDKDTTQRCASSSLPQHSRAPFPKCCPGFSLCLALKPPLPSKFRGENRPENSLRPP